MNITVTKHSTQDVTHSVHTVRTKTLSVKDLTKSYGSTKVLQGIDLEVYAGERVALMGRSGSGKSTLLNCICGIESFDGGEIEVADKKLGKLTSAQVEQVRRQDIGYVFQRFHLLPTLTAFENVEFPARLTGMSAIERKERAHLLLKLVGMEHREKHRPSALSGGECQRVALARSVMNRPRLILADEPTGSLDSTSGESVLDLLEQVSDESETAVLLVTHDTSNTRICNRVVFMRDGIIEEEAL